MVSEILDLPEIEDHRGSLSFVDSQQLPFPVKRAFYIYGIPTGSTRGEHAHKTQQILIIAVAGSFKIKVDDGSETEIHQLSRPNRALYVKEKIWHELSDFSDNAVCLVLSSSDFDQDDYIHDYGRFLEFVK